VSIIQEALKRAQYDYAGKKSLPQAHEKPEQGPAIHVTPEDIYMPVMIRKIAIIVYVIVLLALVTGFGIRALFSKIASMDKERRSKSSTMAKQKRDTGKVALPIAAATVERAKEAPKEVPKEAPLAAASSGQANQAPTFVLNGIMYIRENPKAIINGMVVKEGDVVSGATVTYISENNVLLKYNNNDNQVEVALRLKE